MSTTKDYDIIVVGTGNAGFSAALSAHDSSPLARILLIDKAPPEWAGGNTYFTAGAFRTVFDSKEDVLELVGGTMEEVDITAYGEGDFCEDWMRVTGQRADGELVRTVVGESWGTVKWLRSKGIKFQLSFNRSLPSLWTQLTQTSVQGKRTLEILGRDGPLSRLRRKRSHRPIPAHNLTHRNLSPVFHPPNRPHRFPRKGNRHSFRANRVPL
jgi:succinate dehydrogenase/fumarate reductase flavoprotein subunit